MHGEISECGKVSGVVQFTHLDHISCYLSNTCSVISCCLEDTEIKRNIEVSLSIDPCKFIMKMEIEKLHFNISLLNFTWGNFSISQDFLKKVSFISNQNLNQQ